MSKNNSINKVNARGKFADITDDELAANGERDKLLGDDEVEKPREGTIKSSIFSIVILCLGSGTLTFPYIFYANGLYIGLGLILFGASISLFSGWLIV